MLDPRCRQTMDKRLVLPHIRCQCPIRQACPHCVIQQFYFHPIASMISLAVLYASRRHKPDMTERRRYRINIVRATDDACSAFITVPAPTKSSG